jgi:nucleotide-binding universal stress UspA family protein
MKAIRPILVAVEDPDSKRLPAVEKAAQLALASGASLELFHAIAEPVYAHAKPSGLDNVFIGNTAERVLSHVHCDVLVVEPRHFARRIPAKGRGVQLVASHFPSAF